MSTVTAKDLEKLTAEYRRKVAEVRADDSLSWEKRELKMRELGLKFDKDRKAMQECWVDGGCHRYDGSRFERMHS